MSRLRRRGGYSGSRPASETPPPAPTPSATIRPHRPTAQDEDLVEDLRAALVTALTDVLIDHPAIREVLAKAAGRQ